MSDQITPQTVPGVPPDGTTPPDANNPITPVVTPPTKQAATKPPKTPKPPTEPSDPEPVEDKPALKGYKVKISDASPMRMVRSAGRLWNETEALIAVNDPDLAELQANSWLTVTPIETDETDQ